VARPAVQHDDRAAVRNGDADRASGLSIEEDKAQHAAT